MAAREVHREDVLDKKYYIQRPTYNADELEELQTLISNTALEHPDWNEFWLDEPTIVRFLKAYITVADAYEALVNYCQWRIKHGVDNISPDDHDIKREDSTGRWKVLNDVCDSFGRPVAIEYPKYHDKNHGNYDSLYKYGIFVLEQISSVADQCNGNGTFCVVVDLQGFSAQNMDYKGAKNILWMLKNCYPERLGVALIINYPWIFYGFWEAIKYWINKVSRSKIIFCGESELADYVDINLISPKKL